MFPMSLREHVGVPTADRNDVAPGMWEALAAEKESFGKGSLRCTKFCFANYCADSVEHTALTVASIFSNGPVTKCSGTAQEVLTRC